MEAEPSKAEPPKRKRGWFQFSLRTLVIGVTLVCVVVGGYVLWQKKIVSDRWAMRFAIKKVEGVSDGYRKGYIDRANSNEPERAIPWLRTVLGDQAIRFIGLPVEVPLDYRDRVRAMFPEADVVAIALDSTLGRQLYVAWPDEPPPNPDLYPVFVIK